MMARNINKTTSGNASSTHHKSKMRKNSPDEWKKDPAYRAEQMALQPTTESGQNRSAAESIHAPSRSDKSKKPDNMRKLKSTINKLGKMLREKRKHRLNDVTTVYRGLSIPHIESHRELSAPADAFHSSVSTHESEDQVAGVLVGKRLHQQRCCSLTSLQRTQRRSQALLSQEEQ